MSKHRKRHVNNFKQCACYSLMFVTAAFFYYSLSCAKLIELLLSKWIGYQLSCCCRIWIVLAVHFTPRGVSPLTVTTRLSLQQRKLSYLGRSSTRI